MKIVFKKKKYSEQLFFISYSVYLIYSILMTSFYAKYLTSIGFAVKLFCITLLLIDEIFNMMTKKSLISIAIIGLFSIMSYFIENAYIIFVLLFIYSGRDISFDKIARLTRLISAILLIFIIASAYIGIIPNYISTRANGVERMYLGFRYVLYGPTILFNITALTVYLNKSSIRWKTILLLIFLNIVVYIPTNARLSSGLSILLILADVLLKLKPNILQRRHFLCCTMITSYIICFFLSVVLTLIYKDSVGWLRALNDFMGERLAGSKLAILRYSFGLFGQKVQYFGHGLDIFGQHTREQYLYVDNLYVQMLQTYGLLFAIFIVALNTIGMYRYYRTKQWHMLLIMTMLPRQTQANFRI